MFPLDPSPPPGAIRFTHLEKDTPCSRPSPHALARGEREGPIAQQWEGEVSFHGTIPHDPAPPPLPASPPQGAERGRKWAFPVMYPSAARGVNTIGPRGRRGWKRGGGFQGGHRVAAIPHPHPKSFSALKGREGFVRPSCFDPIASCARPSIFRKTSFRSIKWFFRAPRTCSAMIAIRTKAASMWR
jgi:hypothetical protein